MEHDSVGHGRFAAIEGRVYIRPWNQVEQDVSLGIPANPIISQ